METTNQASERLERCTEMWRELSKEFKQEFPGLCSFGVTSVTIQHDPEKMSFREIEEQCAKLKERMRNIRDSIFRVEELLSKFREGMRTLNREQALCSDGTERIVIMLLLPNLQECCSKANQLLEKMKEQEICHQRLFYLVSSGSSFQRRYT